MTKLVRLLALAAVTGLVAVACSNSTTSTPAGGGSGTAPTSIGPGEGKLNLVAWAGYTEDAWVKPFERSS